MDALIEQLKRIQSRSSTSEHQTMMKATEARKLIWSMMDELGRDLTERLYGLIGKGNPSGWLWNEDGIQYVLDELELREAA